MTDPILRVESLIHRYPSFTLGPIDLTLPPGTVLAIVGPNGSGKTTTLRCLAGRIRPDEGEVETFGRQPGLVSDRHGFFRRWSVDDNLKWLTDVMVDWSEADGRRIARRLGLPLDERVDQLSTGNRTKLALVAELGRSAPLLLLDEPTSGLDPVAREALFDVLRERQEDPSRSVLMCTHILSDLARIADELAFLMNGAIVSRASTVELLESWRDKEAAPMSVEEIALEILKRGETAHVETHHS